MKTQLSSQISPLFNAARLTFFLILLTSVALLTSCEEEDDLQPNPEERLVQVNNTQLNVKELGTGKATVVFVSGLGESLETWKEVQPAVAGFAATISYDRPDTGKSGSVAGTRSSVEIAQELHQLLLNAKVKSPYILVAHSLAGLHVRMYTHLYQQEVAGIVLLDPTTEEELLMLKDIDLPDGMTLEKIADLQKMKGSVKAEFMNQIQSAEQVLTATLPRVPLTLITPLLPEPNEAPGTREFKLMLHGQFVSKVEGATHVQAQQSQHHIQWDQPQLVIETIRQIVQKVE